MYLSLSLALRARCVEDCVASAWRRGRGAWAALRAEILLTCNKRHKAVAQAERKMWVERVFTRYASCTAVAVHKTRHIRRHHGKVQTSKCNDTAKRDLADPYDFPGILAVTRPCYPLLLPTALAEARTVYTPELHL